MLITKNMVDKIIKFIHKSLYREKLLKFLEDLDFWDISNYDIKTIKWQKNTFRCRIWDVRIVFIKNWDNFEVVKIDNRWDIY